MDTFFKFNVIFFPGDEEKVFFIHHSQNALAGWALCLQGPGMFSKAVMGRTTQDLCWPCSSGLLVKPGCQTVGDPDAEACAS